MKLVIFLRDFVIIDCGIFSKIFMRNKTNSKRAKANEFFSENAEIYGKQFSRPPKVNLT